MNARWQWFALLSTLGIGVGIGVGAPVHGEGDPGPQQGPGPSFITDLSDLKHHGTVAIFAATAATIACRVTKLLFDMFVFNMCSRFAA